MYRLFYIVPFVLIFISLRSFATTLHVGNGYPFANLSAAVLQVLPGDTILIHAGTYPGGLFFADLQGTASQPITICAAGDGPVIFSGGTNAWQLSDAAYLGITGLIFEHQTGNGFNCDDGGTYASPAHHLRFTDCVFRDLAASGNNDLLKLSGLDSFEIRNCLFLNGADGGSGIDMVGCHDGLIVDCRFEHMGSNAIQAKGGTRNVRIERNFFKNCGQRSINLGGSTGLPFFRPLDAPYESADLKVYANIFTGSVAPVAFVGTINSSVINNTIYLPDKWVLRILQETVDTARFYPCSNNTFTNNLIVIDNQVSVVCNIGPNTAPETFSMSNNLWYHIDQFNWSGPVLPVSDPNALINLNPLLNDPSSENFSIDPASPAIGMGLPVSAPLTDFYQNQYSSPPSIGGIEGALVSSARFPMPTTLDIYPNPARDRMIVRARPPVAFAIQDVQLTIRSSSGQVLRTMHAPGTNTNLIEISVAGLPPGMYLLGFQSANVFVAAKFVITH